MSAFGAFETPDGPTCSCLSCTEPADAVIEHPEHGERVVCEEHVRDYEVVRYV